MFRVHTLCAALLGAVLFLPAGAASAAEIVEQRPPGKVVGDLRSALTQFSDEAAGQPSSGAWRDALTSKGIIVINGRPAQAAGTGAKSGIIRRAGPGKVRRGPSLAARGIIVINGKPGVQTSLRRLQGAVRAFEQAAGPGSPKVAACRRREGQCLQQCRATLRQLRLNGTCSCIGVRAQCLEKGYRLSPATGKVRFGDGKTGRRLPSGK